MVWDPVHNSSPIFIGQSVREDQHGTPAELQSSHKALGARRTCPAFLWTLAQTHHHGVRTSFGSFGPCPASTRATLCIACAMPASETKSSAASATLISEPTMAQAQAVAASLPCPASPAAPDSRLCEADRMGDGNGSCMRQNDSPHIAETRCTMLR